MDDLGLQFCFPTPPSYLKELLRQEQEEEICLAYNKKAKSPTVDSVISFSDESPPISRKTQEFDSTNLDLTGCPLKVDLYGDTLSSTFIFDRPNNWTDEEISHVPVTLNEARKFINQYNRRKAKHTVYCVCDGNDKKQTVILGAKVSKNLFMRCQVFVVGIFPYGHQNLTVDYMREKHLKNVGISDAAIQCHTTSSFSIYGYNNLINSPAFVNIEKRGSILLDISWAKCTYEIPKTKADYQITLQVIIGHTDSQANALWEEINFLEYCINVARRQDIQNVKLNQCGDCLDVLTDEVDGIFSKQYTRKPRSQEQQQTLDFKSLRDTDVVDDLWSVLRKSQTVSDLRDCFHYIFEYLAVSNLKVNISKNSDTTFLTIIKGISSGKTAVPTLTFHQSMELLIEHGLEKLKNDYLCIIDHFCSVPAESLMADWNKLSSVLSGSSAGKMSMKPEYSRKTRMTFKFDSGGNEILNTQKLKHLARMHVIVEFFLLIQEHSKFPSKCYQYIGEYAVIKYMGPDSPIQNFSALEKSKLCDLTLKTDCIDASIVKDKSPVKFHMQMTSTLNKSEVTTIFLHSESPIFPTVVFNNYDLSLSYADEKLFYVTELVRYTQFLM